MLNQFWRMRFRNHLQGTIRFICRDHHYNPMLRHCSIIFGLQIHLISSFVCSIGNFFSLSYSLTLFPVGVWVQDADTPLYCHHCRLTCSCKVLLVAVSSILCDGQQCCVIISMLLNLGILLHCKEYQHTGMNRSSQEAQVDP